jgi:hypothetical protein
MRFFREDKPWNDSPLHCSIEGLMNAMPIITGGSAAAGVGGNILEEYKKMQYNNFVMSLLKDPAKLAAAIAKIQQPLNAGLTQAVGNQVQGNMAERGLAQAPGTFAASESQALAPFYEENLNTATQAFLQSLGMPAGTFGSPVNTSGPMALFLQSLKNRAGGGTGGTDVPAGGLTFPNYDWNTPTSDWSVPTGGTGG